MRADDPRVAERRAEALARHRRDDPHRREQAHDPEHERQRQQRPLPAALGLLGAEHRDRDGDHRVDARREARREAEHVARAERDDGPLRQVTLERARVRGRALVAGQGEERPEDETECDEGGEDQATRLHDIPPASILRAKGRRFARHGEHSGSVGECRKRGQPSLDRGRLVENSTSGGARRFPQLADILASVARAIFTSPSRAMARAGRPPSLRRTNASR